jgi:hypothetical protein
MHKQFSFSVRPGGCFPVPTYLASSAQRAVAVKTGCVAAIAVATRSGLDGREHGAKFSWVGSPPPPHRQRSLIGKQSEVETALPRTGLPPRKLFLLTIGRKSEAAKRGVEDAGLEVGHDRETIDPPFGRLSASDTSDRSSVDLYNYTDQNPTKATARHKGGPRNLVVDG